MSKRLGMSAVKIQLPHKVKEELMVPMGSKIWIDGTPIQGVRSIGISPITMKDPIIVTIELFADGLEIEYADPTEELARKTDTVMTNLGGVKA